MKKVLTFGEILLRQQSIGDSFFGNSKNLLKIFPGGSEANVACSLAAMGQEVAYFSAFPEHALSLEIIQLMQDKGVDLSRVWKGGDRLGSYILLSANGLSKGEVIYDRKYSSFSQMRIEDIDLEALLADIDWLHWSALTPGLNEEMAALMLSVLKAAERKGIYISVDLNYRNKLWQYGKDPIDIMPELVSYCDVIMGNIWAANKMLGSKINPDFNRDTNKSIYLEFANQVAADIRGHFPRCKHVANTFRFMDSAMHNLFYGTYHTEEGDYVSCEYATNMVVDRIGSGDAFMAGLIHAIRAGMSNQEIIETATGAGYRKLFVEGDFGNGEY